MTKKEQLKEEVKKEFMEDLLKQLYKDFILGAIEEMEETLDVKIDFDFEKDKIIIDGQEMNSKEFEAYLEERALEEKPAYQA